MRGNPLNAKIISRIDRKNMLDLLVSFPDQCKRALSIGKIAAIPGKFKKAYRKIVFLGLGGSAIGADIIKSYLIQECGIPIHVIRDYSVPRFVGRDSLVIATSYSGNTEETLSMYKQVKARKANIIAVTSGGKLGKLAEKNMDLLVSIPKGLPPRCALGYSFIPSLMLLSRLKIIQDKTKALKDMISLLRQVLREDVGPDARKNLAKKIAGAIHGKFPVIYAAATHMDVVTVRWRGQLSENAKTVASCHVYPEMNHNEIVGWHQPYNLLKQFIIITIKDKGDHSRVKTRMEVTNSILKKAGFNVIEVTTKGDLLLSRMMSAVYIGDFVSFYLSIMSKIDPTPVERISYLKQQLSKRG